LKDGFWRADFGDGLTAIVFEASADDGRVPWYVSGSDREGAKMLCQGLSSNIEEAKLAAEAAALDRKDGSARFP
jgi:hypothetical protein